MTNYLNPVLARLSLILFLCCPYFLKGQAPHQDTCGTMGNLDLLLQQDPAYEKRMQEIEELSARYVARQQQRPNRNVEEIIIIPVVVHVLYNTANQNISDTRVFSQLQVLNEDFRRLNADTASTWPQADDSRIEFCLAKLDPNGNPTTGITRTQTNTSVFGFDNSMKFTSQGGRDAWPRDEYLNIWVCDLVGGLLGYAQFPGGPAATDGIVVNTASFGSYSSSQLGRTTTHEVGHWLNLRHIWGDGDCSQDDFVADTPPSDGPNSGCSNNVSCNTQDMIENYMDYTRDFCMNLFTTGQKDRMRAVFAPGGPRESLLSSQKCCIENPSCPFVFGWSATPLSDTSMLLTVPPVDSSRDYFFRYRAFNTSQWDTLPAFSDSSLVITGLTRCTDYTIEFSAFCDSSSSAFACNQKTAQTLGCCEAPTLTNANLIGDSASFNWLPIYGAFQYGVRYRQVNTSTWNQEFTSDTVFVLPDLEGCQEIEFQFNTYCSLDQNIVGNFGDRDTLVLPYQAGVEGCTQCDDTAYCFPNALSGLGGIDDVLFGPIDQRDSDVSPMGFGNYSAISYDMQVDSTYDFVLNSVNGDAMEWKIWIDYNQNGTFNDPGELVFEKNSASAQVSDQLTIDPDVMLGPTRMRIGARLPNSSSNWIACQMNGFGEYEDYCLTFQPRCVNVTSALVSMDSLGNTLDLSWNAVKGNRYEVGYQIEGSSTWTNFKTQGNTLQFGMDSLFGCTNFVFRVRFDCYDGSGTFINTDTIKTLCRVDVEESFDAKLEVYPNPAKDRLFIRASTVMDGVRLYNSMGMLLESQEGNKEVYHIGTQSFSSGMYMLEVEAEGRSYWRRVLIQN